MIDKPTDRCCDRSGIVMSMMRIFCVADKILGLLVNDGTVPLGHGMMQFKEQSKKKFIAAVAA